LRSVLEQSRQEKDSQHSQETAQLKVSVGALTEENRHLRAELHLVPQLLEQKKQEYEVEVAHVRAEHEARMLEHSSSDDRYKQQLLDEVRNMPFG
jgi:hypothetical protein